jgi:hypothetical protein
MKNTHFYLLVFSIVLALVSCQKEEVVKLSLLTQTPVVNAIESDTLSGTIKGTMKANHTYYVISDITVNAGDTLLIEEGVKVIVLGNFMLNINGAFISKGTETNQIWLTVTEGMKQEFPEGGAWGGLNCNGAQIFEAHWTHFEYAGGPDQTNDPRYGISVINDSIQKFILHDSWISNTLDDGIRIYSAKNISILRNTFERNGGPEGEALNLQLGVSGVFAYNVVWSSATNCMKIYTHNVLRFPTTDLVLHNNTYINTGYRRLQKPGNAILLDRFVKAKVYNNIFYNCRQSLRITNFVVPDDMEYGNNLFFTNLTDETLKQNTIDRFYPAGDYGKPQASDLMMVDPKLGYVNPDIETMTFNLDLRPLNNSPVLGAGNPIYNNDIGAYTTDGKGNKH